MYKRIFVSLMFVVSCALLLAACGGSETTSNNTSTTNSASTTNTTKTTSSPTTTSSPATTKPATGEKIGVAECDDYLDKYESCISSKVPEAARAQLEASMKQTRDSWRSLAANPQTKSSLAAACKMATDQAKTSMKAYGCDF